MTENRADQPQGAGSDNEVTAAPPSGAPHPSSSSISIGRTRLSIDGRDSDVFTMTLGTETIQLLPFRNWGQLDVYKWRVQGKLPGTPAGLEVTFDHVKVGGETVATADADGCSKLQRAFDEWLLQERNNVEIARKKAQARPGPIASTVSGTARSGRFQFKVEVDKRQQVHINCLRGNELACSIGLTVQGFSGLFSQGLMRKPQSLEVGALHDWVELDGELCSFEHGNNDALKLESLLNSKYIPLSSTGHGTDILLFANAASPTGFDIQFPVTVGGMPEARRRTLNDAALELLQEPVRCGVLQPGLIIKISPPTLIFKRKTPDGGEVYLDKIPENRVMIIGDDGRERFIDLSQPVNYTKLGVVELSAVFNHTSVNRHARLPDHATKASEVVVAIPVPQPVPSEPAVLHKTETTVEAVQPVIVSAPLQNPEAELKSPAPTPVRSVESAPSSHLATPPPLPARPNAWLKEVLTRPSIRYDWFSCLMYSKIAEHFANSREGTFGTGKCWSVALSDSTDIGDSEFKGVFLTQKGGLGFLGAGRQARFHQGVLFLGTRDKVVEGIGAKLIAVGVDDQDRLVFIVSEDYQTKFGIPREIILEETVKLSQAGAVILSMHDALESAQPLRVVWTVPAEQPTPSDPQAVESRP